MRFYCVVNIALCCRGTFNYFQWSFEQIPESHASKLKAADKGKSASRWLHAALGAQQFVLYSRSFGKIYNHPPVIQQLTVNHSTSAGMSLTFPFQGSMPLARTESKT